MYGCVFGRNYNGVIYFDVNAYFGDHLYKSMLHDLYPDAAFNDKAGEITLTQQPADGEKS